MFHVKHGECPTRDGRRVADDGRPERRFDMRGHITRKQTIVTVETVLYSKETGETSTVTEKFAGYPSEKTLKAKYQNETMRYVDYKIISAEEVMLAMSIDTFINNSFVVGAEEEGEEE